MAKTKLKVTDPKIVQALSAAASVPQPGPSSTAEAVSTAETVLIEKPADAIKTAGTQFHDLYARYVTLRELARPLNGLSQASVLPDNITIKAVTLDFTVNDVAHSVTLDTVRGIGEIAPLLSAALRVTIEQMSQELFSLHHLVSGMQQSIQQALAAASRSAAASQESPTDEKTVQPD